MPADLPKKFGPYLVLDQIGSGGMGAVYRALDPRLQREVAVKVLHRNLEVSGARERFLREARAVSSLNHPNICTVFDIGEQDGDPYLVMELLQGEALKERIARGPVPEDDLREVAFRVALALQAAHGRGVVHRDIKPANIFLVSDGSGAVDVKVLDFGLAKLEREVDSADTTRALTRAGSTVGTVEYMSPEQACGEELDARTDLFSLGAVLYEMATGQLPFPGATSAIVFAALLNRDPTPPREANLELSADLDRTIRSLMVKKRADRMQSATALLEALSVETEAQAESSTPGSADSSREAVARASAGPAVPTPRRMPAAAGEPLPGMVNASGTIAQVPDAGTSRIAAFQAAADVMQSRANRASGAGSPSAREEDEPADPLPANRRRRTGEKSRPGSRSRVPLEAVSISTASTPVDASTPHSKAPWVGLIVLLLLGGAAAVWLVLRSRNPVVAHAIRGPVQIIPLQNQTGDALLDRAPTELLQLLLRESPLLTVRSPAAIDVLEGGRDGTAAQSREQSDPRLAPGPTGHAVELYTVSGVVSRSDDAYLIHLSVKQAADGTELTTVEDTANSLTGLSAKFVQLVSQLRTQMGESAASVSENAADLADATENLPALAAAAEGDARAETGDDAAALTTYRNALRQAPGFTAARLRLAMILLRLHAGRDAAAVLEPTAASALAGGPGLRAEREYVLAVRSGSGDGALAAAERWHALRPDAADAQDAWTEQLLRRGRANEAVTSANVAVRLNPFRLRSRQLQTRAEIESGQANAAWATQTRAFSAGLGSPGLSLAAAVLGSDAARITPALAQVRIQKPGFALLLDDAVYRANAGDLSGASAAFDRAGAVAEDIGGATSAAQYAVALKLWNLSLGGECPVSAPPAAFMGEAAVLMWMTSAWCHLPTPASAEAPQDARAQAAKRWLAGDKDGALATLNTAHEPEALLLRARLELMLGQPDAAISNARALVDRRGSAYLSGSISYPAALALLAAAYRSTGDEVNATMEQGALRDVWKDAAASKRLLQAAAGQR